jgi:hypothetical protein
LRTTAALLLGALLVVGPARVVAQEGTTQTRKVSPEELRSAIDRLSTIDFTPRMEAARTIRRAPAAAAVPALSEAALKHADGYVRFRSLILLSGFNDPRAKDVMVRMLDEKNDRLRAVGYTFFEFNTDPALIPRLLDGLAKEEGEFVRPALTRALAAHAADPRARAAVLPLVTKGQDFFRSVAIEAIGEYKGLYAFDAIDGVAKLDGPLQDDAVLALGRLGDKRAVETLAGLQRTAPRHIQPSIAAAICLIGVNCASHRGYLSETLSFATANPGFQELLRAAAGGLGALAAAGDTDALETLITVGAPSRDPARAAIALALGGAALRNTPAFLSFLAKRKDIDPVLDLLHEAFDMLEEDFNEERFFVTVRRSYWQATAGSPERRAAEALIRKLEF